MNYYFNVKSFLKYGLLATLINILLFGFQPFQETIDAEETFIICARVDLLEENINIAKIRWISNVGK